MSQSWWPKFPFRWPDPHDPRFVTRDLTLMRGKSKGLKSGPPLRLQGIRLIELIPHCLYLVPQDAHPDASGEPRLRAGAVLSRNLALSERLSDDASFPADQAFVSYVDGVFDARRGVAYADRRYRTHEIPANQKLAGTLDQLIRMSWTLTSDNEDGQGAFVLVAAEAAQDYGTPVNPDKVAAKERVVQASSVTDTLGRFNPGRIPLICFAGKNRVRDRVQAVRGIGRRMGFREAVLEHSIDRLREIAQAVQMSQEHRLRAKWMREGPVRTPARVRSEAQRILLAADRLDLVVARPFARVFGRCVADMRQAGHHLSIAAERSNPSFIDLAREDIERVYRSMVLSECHWRMQNVLLAASLVQQAGEDVSASQSEAWSAELDDVHTVLTHDDPLTGVPLDRGFQTPVLARIAPRVQLAHVHLNRIGGADLPTVIQELHEAVEPL